MITSVGNKTFKINLNKKEIDYLCDASFLEKNQMEILYKNKSKISIDFDSKKLIETFRDKFTLRLAEVGFDESYELTDEGKILENLIDKFFTELFPPT